MENCVKSFRKLAVRFACLYSNLGEKVYELIMIFEQYQGEILLNICESNIDFRIILCQIMSQSLRN